MIKHPLIAIHHTEANTTYLGRLVADSGQVPPINNQIIIDHYTHRLETTPKTEESIDAFLQRIYLQAENDGGLSKGTYRTIYTGHVAIHEVPHDHLDNRIQTLWKTKGGEAYAKELAKLTDASIPRAGEIDLSESIRQAENRTLLH